MIDFSSALYLGMGHASPSLPRFDRLTLGKPAALESPPGSRALEQELAVLTGCERALLAPSTLHLFWDLLGTIILPGISVFVDSGAYPIARWGAERARGAGLPVIPFREHDAQDLRQKLRRAGVGRPVVLADGFNPATGEAAPIAGYLDCVKPRDGLVVIDDTQSLGIFGHSPGPLAPYGSGGGGSLQRARIRDRGVVMIGSLAKAFGAPLAVLAGSESIVSMFERRSATRVHSSPPSVASIAAGWRALEINRSCGDQLRLRLAQLVTQLRRGLGRLGIVGVEGLFPVQSLQLPRGEAIALYEALLSRGLETVLHRNGRDPRISVVLTAGHSSAMVGRLLQALEESVKGRESYDYATTGGRRALR